MTPLDTLVRRLHEGGCTLVVAQGDDVRLFTRRGVADLISRPALDLLSRAGIDVTYDTLTDHIVNRDGTDWCPVERLCRPLDNIDEMVDAIRAFIHRKQTTL